MPRHLFRSVEAPDKRAEAVSLLAFLMRLIWLCILPLVFLSIYLAVHHIHSLQAQLDEDAEHVVRNVGTAIDSQVSSQIGALEVLAASPLVDYSGRLNDFYKETLAFRNSFGGHVILADLSMQMLFHTRKPFGATLPKLPKPKGRAAAPEVVKTGKAAVGDMFFGPLAKEPLVAVVVPVIRDGQTVLLLLSIIETRQFQLRLDEVSLPLEWSLKVLDSTGAVMARRTPPSMSPQTDEEERTRRFVANSALSPWSVVLTVPQSVFRSPIITAMKGLVAAILVATVVSLLGGWLSSRRLAASVAALAEASSARTSGLQINEIESVRQALVEAAAARQEAETTRLESERRFKQLFDIAPVPLCFVDKDGRLVNVNARFKQTFGYSHDEVPTHTKWRQMAYPDENYRRWVVESWEAAVGKARLHDADIEPVEYSMTCKNGEVRAILVSGTLLGDDFLAVFFDITDRKRAEEALRETTDYLQNLLDHASAPIIVWDSQFRVTIFNSAFERLVGLKAAEILEKSPELLFPMESKESSMERIQAASLGERWESVEIPIQHVDGSIRLLLWNSATVCAADGTTPVVTIAQGIDITERKNAEAALRTSEAQLSNAARIAHLGPWEYDVAEDVFTFNDHFYEIFRSSAKLFGGYKMSSADYSRRFVHPDDREVVEIETRKAIETSDPIYSRQLEHRILYADGAIGYISVRFFVVKDSLGRTVKTYGVNQDITHQKMAEKALQESEERYVLVTDLVGHLIYDYDVTSGNIKWTGAIEETTGYSPEEFQSVDIAEWEELIHPDDRGAAVDLMAQAGQTMRTISVVYRIKKKDETYAVVENTGAFLYDSSGKAYRMLGVMKDISDRIREEEEKVRLREQLYQSQKIEAIGTLAGGIAHDFNNLLQIISGNAELLEMELTEKNLEFGEIEVIRQTSRHGADLVKQILMFSRKADTKFEILDLNQHVKNAERLLYHTIPKMIEIELCLDEPLKHIRADSTQIEQLLINLAVNAKDAMPKGGKLILETRNVCLDEHSSKGHSGLSPGRYVLMRVSDTGHGMEQHVLQHIFEPFFTTKGLANGTGLGLATVFGIVKMHGGHVTCETEIGKGTAFDIYFPAVDDEPRGGTGQEEPPIAGGTETILLVDDEPLIRDLAKRILEKSGYSILVAGSGKEGLEMYQRHRSEISLVILDLIMPQMAGNQCLEELLKMDPQVKALIASGFAVEGRTKKFLDGKAKGFVTKPFKMRELLRSVRHALDKV